MPSTHAQCDELFFRWNQNGTGKLSLAEIDGAIKESVRLAPKYHHSKALILAYKAADVNETGFIDKREFRLLLDYLIYFAKLWTVFETMDSGRDG